MVGALGCYPKQGRVILIRSVIESLLLYFMSTVLLPQSVLNTVKSKIKRFFWAPTKQRYLAYLPWHAVSTPRSAGGLGLRDIALLNKALLNKALWKFVSGYYSLWGRIMTAKYLQRGTLWHTERKRDCSRLWRAMLQVRPILEPQIRWSIDHGTRCPLFTSPWCNNWRILKPVSSRQRQMRLCEVFNDSGTVLNLPSLSAAVGISQATAIFQEHQTLTLHRGLPDRLMFVFSPSGGVSNGEFTLRKAYKLLTTTVSFIPSCASQHTSFWQRVWRHTGVTPRIRLFIWKAVLNAIPVAHALHSRISTITPTCCICDQQPKTVTHMLFYCPPARSTWFHSQLGIKYDLLPSMTLMEMLVNLWDNLDDGGTAYSMIIMWCIWKSRCAHLYGDQPINPQRMVAEASALSYTAQQASLFATSHSQHLQSSVLPLSQVHSYPFSCQVDGSFSNPDNGGASYILKHSTTLLQYGLVHNRAFSAF